MAAGNPPTGRPDANPLGDPVGRVLAGKYRVVRRIGGGALADVYEAVHEQLGGRMAVKILRREFARFPDLSRRFLVEARAASSVNHPGILQVFDIGQLDSGELFLVMELLQGEDLGTRLVRQGRFDIPTAVRLALQLLEALDAAHRAGVIHRDLKPENILLVPGPGGREWVKIIDFGIARLAREGPAALRGTAEGSVLGSPYYMSPEQARGQTDIDPRTDLYAVGVLLYEMLTGELPYTGLSVAGVTQRVLSEPFPSPRDVLPSLPEALEQVILKATARDRERRFPTAAALADALRPFRAPGDTDSLPPPPPPLPAPPAAERSPEEAGPPAEAAARATTPAVPARVYVVAGAVAVAAAVLAATLFSLLHGVPGGTAPAATVPPAAGDAATEPPLEAGGPGATVEVLSGAAPDAVPALVPEVGSETIRSAMPDAGDAAGAGAEPEAAGAADAPALPRCTVRLRGVPPGARIRFDGREAGETFDVEPSPTPRMLEVAARGWKTYRELVRVEREMQIMLRMERQDGAMRDAGVPSSPDAGIPAEAGRIEPAEASARDAGARDGPGFAPNPFGG